MSSPLGLGELLERLADAGVRFVLVGGLAVNAWGYLRGTHDIDIVAAPERENLERLANLLASVGGRVEAPQGRLGSSAIITFLVPATVPSCLQTSGRSTYSRDIRRCPASRSWRVVRRKSRSGALPCWSAH